ncbi:HNH endonuclease family protein [Ammonicoccus fulvus]|uniref:HNH endonuclease family protein n=1 Tax=Ammonicoccus fulvus TaxID=3138240 RepID=A0ABZ3FT23_9ACTN
MTVAVLVLIGGGVAYLLERDSARTEPGSATGPSAGPGPIPGAVGGALAGLGVSDAAPPAGYDGRLFNFNGFDFDRNGCDARNDTLARDLTEVVFRPGSNDCRVESGILHDRYSDESLPVTRDQVDIDHVVALGNAWASGASTWSPERRQDFANDPLVLVATLATHNRAKASSDASRWLPPAAATHCAYAARQVAVKQRYELTVTTTELGVLEEILSECPDEPLPDGTEAPPQAGRTDPAPVAASPQASATRAPRPAGTPDGDGIYRQVSPGAYCSPEGAWGTTDTGTPMVCRLTPGADRPRWRAA